eukprot:gene19795-25737_t
MASVSTSALVIAFPVVLIDLDMSITTMMWVLLILLLLLACVVPTAGKLGDMFGQSNIYIFGYWVFVLGSLGGGFVQKKNQGYDLIVARIVIGFGAALLFTNSSAIITNYFSPYGKVGLAQGVLQMFSAMGIVFGPLIGGGFAQTNWRWILWYNAPSGGLLALLATYLLVDFKEKKTEDKVSLYEHLKDFDYIGSISCVCCLSLILIALVQAVVATPGLSSNGAIAGLVLGGAAAGAIFIYDQYTAKNPLIPLHIFDNKIFTLTTIAATAMAFVRNSITYNMIFYLQGPYAQSPLNAGIKLIPFGIGIMASGFAAGALTDKIGARNMATTGPLITLAGVSCLSVMDQNTSNAYVGGILFLTGLGIGLFNSPNAATNMLSVSKEHRGVAAAVGLPIHKMLKALQNDYYIVMACCVICSICALSLPKDIRAILIAKHSTKVSVDTIDRDESKEELEKSNHDYVKVSDKIDVIEISNEDIPV